jgi:hypothetical protein
MDVSLIVARVVAQCPSFEQVITAPSSGTMTPVATQAALATLLSPIVNDYMYPIQLPESPTHPSIVYQLVSSSPGVFEGYDVTHTDLFILNVRGTDYDELIELVGGITSVLSTANIDITDAVHDYDQAENLFRINLELTYTYITSSAQTLPAVFVYPLSRSAEGSAYDNYTKQLVRADYAFLIVTDDNDIIALQTELQHGLLGWQQAADYHEMEYSNGSSIEGIGALKMWREVYSDGYYLTQI